MKFRDIFIFILRAPLVVLVLISFVASLYAIIKGIYPISFATPILLGIIISMYFIGGYLKYLDGKRKTG